MIGKIHYATIFSGLSAYILQQGRKLAEVLAASGVRTSSPEEMAADFELQRSMRPGLRRAVEHVSLAWPPGETDKLSNEVMARAALRYMEQRGIDPAQTQWVLVRHYDQDHPHAHLLLNRVTDTGGVVPDKHSHLRSAEACRKVEAEMGFADAAKLGAEQTLARAEYAEPAAKNVERLRLKATLNQVLEKHLPTATTIPELQQSLATEGIKLKVLLQKGKLQGVVFTAEAYPNLPMKGSEVARSYSGGELRKTLEAQAKQGQAVERERQVRQQVEANRNRQGQQVKLQTQNWEVTATGEQQLHHQASGRQIRLVERESYGQPLAPAVPAAGQQATLRRGRLEVMAGPEGPAAERAEHLGRQLTAAGAHVESITPLGTGGRAELTYRYEWRGPQAMSVNQALQQLQATAGVLVREQDQGFPQLASEWPVRAGQVGQAIVLLYDNEQRPAADRVAAATRLLEEKGAQVGPARSHPDGSVELAISYQTQHPDFAALSQRLDQWNEQDDIDVVETDYGSSLRAETRQATAAASGLSSEAARPERIAEPTPGKETEIDFDD